MNAARALPDEDDERRVRNLIEENWAHIAQTERTQAGIAAAVQQLHPGAVGLVQQAAADPEVNQRNFAAWARAQLPAAGPLAMEVLVTALGMLFVACVQGLADDAAAPPETAETTVWDPLPAVWQSLPRPPEIASTFDMDGWTRAREDGESVVDCVFAKARGETGGR